MNEETRRYLDPDQDAGRSFLTRGIDGGVVMLNLLRFHDVADYSTHPELQPAVPVSGAAAYDAYIEHTRPFLEEAGGSIEFIGLGGRYLIGPADERWDLVIMVRHASVDAFMSFATNEAYLSGLGHRNAALLDSRLLPVVETRPDTRSTA